MPNFQTSDYDNIDFNMNTFWSFECNLGEK